MWGKSSPQDKTSTGGQVTPKSPSSISSFSALTLLNLPVAVSKVGIFLNFEMTWSMALCSHLGESKPEPLQEGELQKKENS